MCKSNGNHILLGGRDGLVFGDTARAGKETEMPRTQNGKFPRISEKIPKNNRNQEISNHFTMENSKFLLTPPLKYSKIQIVESGNVWAKTGDWAGEGESDRFQGEGYPWRRYGSSAFAGSRRPGTKAQTWRSTAHSAAGDSGQDQKKQWTSE